MSYLGNAQRLSNFCLSYIWIVCRHVRGGGGLSTRPFPDGAQSALLLRQLCFNFLFFKNVCVRVLSVPLNNTI